MKIDNVMYAIICKDQLDAPVEESGVLYADDSQWAFVHELAYALSVLNPYRLVVIMSYEYTQTGMVDTAYLAGEGHWLVMDIIKAAPPPRAIARHLIDELNRRQGVLPESESIRIRGLVESTINSIVHLKLEPNGFTFTGRGVPMAHNKNNRPIRSCRWSSCLSRVANSWTTWPAEVFGADVDMNSKTALTRIATLIVAAVLCDQLK